MKSILFFAALLFCCFGFAQNRKAQFRILDANWAHTLYVAFADGDWDVSGLQSQYGFALEKAILISDEKLDALARHSSDGGQSARHLKHIFKVALQNPTNERLLELAAQLEALGSVSYCELVCTKPVPPPGDIAPTTPNYFAEQAYIQANPGVNMQFAWDLGATGSGMRIRDVEYGFNKNHEEFNDNTGAFMQPGAVVSPSVTEDYSEHGTAVFGIVVGDNGSYGVTGMAYGASEMIQFPEWTTSGYSPASAISGALAVSEEGDVIVLEMQEYGVNAQFVPGEYSQIVWDLTQAATNAGIHVIAAAGNGNANLDGASYTAYMNRGDSGAIIVGAGSSDAQHDKISYSTYGNRVNLQAWANNVRSSGYGSYSEIAGDFNQRYCTFTGTSAATPIVASCAIVLQSYYRDLTGQNLSPSQMRQLLIDTGVAQGSGGHIGPIPNMQAAISAINNLANENLAQLSFAVYPNPAKDKAVVSGAFSSDLNVEVINAFGQIVARSKTSDVDLAGLASGVYFVKVRDGAKTGVKRLVKI